MNDRTTAADELREAVKKLKELAGKATPGPWAAHPDGLVWAQRLGDPVSGSTEVEDAQHIALMHPGVALAVADLLTVLSWFPSTADPTDLAVAVQLARAINGGAQ